MESKRVRYRVGELESQIQSWRVRESDIELEN